MECIRSHCLIVGTLANGYLHFADTIHINNFKHSNNLNKNKQLCYMNVAIIINKGLQQVR